MKVLKYLLLLGVAVAALVYGVTVIELRGYDRRDAEARVEQERLKAQTEQLLHENETDARERNEVLKQELDETRAQADARITQLTNHLAKQAQNHKKATQDASPNPHAPAAGSPAQGDPVLLGAAVLDELTVRLLDDARANRPAQEAGGAADGGDEEGRAAATPTAVTGGQFAINDLMVVRQYHELAARHDTLVEWIKHQCIDPALAGEFK